MPGLDSIGGLTDHLHADFGFFPANDGKKHSLAYAEVRTILARMIWNFEMELCEESRGWAEQKIYFLWDKPSLKVVLKPRVGFEG